MSSLADRLTAFAGRMRDQYNNKIAPRLLPPGGGGGMMLIRASDTPWHVGWAIPPQIPNPHYCNVYQDTNAATNGGGGINVNDPTAPPFYRYLFTEKRKDDEGLFDLTKCLYTIPESGLYMITAYIRPPDSINNSWFGFGVDTVQADNENFLWSARFNAAGPTQMAFQYSRIGYLTKSNPNDDNTKLRMYGYGFGFKPSKAALQIAMVSKPF
jgi:hypothetical protein